MGKEFNPDSKIWSVIEGSVMDRGYRLCAIWHADEQDVELASQPYFPACDRGDLLVMLVGHDPGSEPWTENWGKSWKLMSQSQ